MRINLLPWREKNFQKKLYFFYGSCFFGFSLLLVFFVSSELVFSKKIKEMIGEKINLEERMPLVKSKYEKINLQKIKKISRLLKKEETLIVFMTNILKEKFINGYFVELNFDGGKFLLVGVSKSMQFFQKMIEVLKNFKLVKQVSVLNVENDKQKKLVKFEVDLYLYI